MKKLIICLAIATVAVSCKKIQAGGNKGTLKLEEGVERYSDDEQTSGHEENLADNHTGAAHEEHKADTLTTDSTRAQKSPEVTTSRLEKPSAEH
ncbi:hypothetical protein CHRY9390_02792 [Chryseobacterium aquaeductus]|uniref:Uncharacterized protein n=1 Tax=Chryseobacterium aquaeductus TaxID=2675056 RepID=A0A9N8MHW8_9FLAO|nr:hypothetical protein [Chryseobacterium aquaeductus]CAA7332071.1 hypothetical protein CHRY9390_02792 [Chryseobacterium potabilaquae]CAD7814357.1 hypothetical protein CHRY9390_02792 [Chryseobacterium aquaeductus]